MVVRSFKIEDMDAVVRMYCECFAESPWFERFDPDEVRADFQTYLGWPETVFLTAVVEGRVVGVLIGFDIVRQPDVCRPLRKRERGGTLYLAEVFVRQDRRRRGTARELIQAFFSAGARQGYARIALRTSVRQRIILKMFDDHRFRRRAEQDVVSKKFIRGAERNIPDKRVILVGRNPCFRGRG